MSRWLFMPGVLRERGKQLNRPGQAKNARAIQLYGKRPKTAHRW
jgi:hypothetical protein